MQPAPSKNLLSEFGGSAGDRAVRRRASREDADLRVAVEVAAREWRQTVDTLDSPVLVVEWDGRIRRLNREAALLLGLPFADAIGANLSVLARSEPWASALDAVQTSRDAGRGDRRQCRDGSGRTWEIVTTVSRGADPPWVVVVLHDLTERVALEERLRRTEVMSALGSLVAGVAHEARNPLFGISAALDAFVSRFGDDPRFTPFIKVLQGEVNRLRDLVHDLFEYGRAPNAGLDLGDLGALIEDAVAAVAGLAEEHGVAVRSRVDQGLPRVFLDGSRLGYVFNNLLQNAIQHSEAGATVEVAAARASQRPGAGVRFTVRDRGTGIAPADLPRIFEPFFSRRRGGFGLGLAVAHRIVEDHGGTLRARNHPEGGAELEAWLPSVESRPSREAGR